MICHRGWCLLGLGFAGKVYASDSSRGAAQVFVFIDGSDNFVLFWSYLTVINRFLFELFAKDIFVVEWLGLDHTARRTPQNYHHKYKLESNNFAALRWKTVSFLKRTEPFQHRHGICLFGPYGRVRLVKAQWRPDAYLGAKSFVVAQGYL